MNVYGAPHDDRKEAFLAELASFVSKTFDPYIVGGDFNIIRYSSEKKQECTPWEILNYIQYYHQC
jgi:hypothetical protein